MSDEPEVIDNDEEDQKDETVPSTSRPDWSWFWGAVFGAAVGAILTVVTFSGIGRVYATKGETISLSGAEKTQAIAISEHRQKIGFERQEVRNEVTAKIDRLNEEENALNVDAAKLCFELKKAHKLEGMWNLNEYKGELVKQ